MSANSTGDHSPGLGTHGGNSTNSTGAGAGGANAGGGGKTGGDPQRALMFAMRHIANEHQLEYYAAALCGVIAVFIFLHWTRFLVTRSKPAPTPITRPFVLVSRRVRNVLVRAFPGFNSAGHGLLVAVYVGINLTIIFTNINKSDPSYVAPRFGWALLANICFVVFLALKNTPLAFLTSYSYERLNNLHQIVGCTVFVLVLLHGLTYTLYFNSRNLLRLLREKEQIAGIVAGFAILCSFVSAMLLRRFYYETFYAMHILSFITAIVAIGFHRPEIPEHIFIVTSLTAGMFIADRTLRISRFLFYSVNNEATVYPLPNGGTRIVLSKKPARAVPGKHCFVWLPRIRLLEMHPFTVIATKPLEFVVKEYNGFTRDLHAYATAHPGARLRASVEGPYGTFPDPMRYDKIILIAGGSGASYTFGLAVNMLERMTAESAKNIVFIWTTKTHENLTWFASHLETLRTHPNAPKVHVSLYVSRSPGSSSSLGSLPEVPVPTSPGSDLEKAVVEHAAETVAAPKAGDPEKAGAHEHHDDAASETSRSPLRHAVSSGRPDTATIVTDAVRASGPGQRVLVAACGPPGLMKTVRNATARCITGDGPGVELHCEQFGW